MKKLLFWGSLLLMWLPFLTYAQTTTFAPVGAKWTYNYEHINPNTGNKAYGITTYDVEADTMLLGKTARRIRVKTTDALGTVIADSIEHIAIEGQKVFYIRQDTILQPLFDFGASVGDSVGIWVDTTTDYGCASAADKGYLQSISTYIWQGVSQVNYEIYYSAYNIINDTIPVPANYASIVANESKPFLKGFDCFTTVGNFGRNYSLRCYNDSMVSIRGINWAYTTSGYPCDTLLPVVTTGLKTRLIQNVVNISQTSSEVIIDLQTAKSTTYHLYSLSGQRLLSGEITEATTQIISTQSLPAGLYILTVSGERFFESKKIMIP